MEHNFNNEEADYGRAFYDRLARSYRLQRNADNDFVKCDVLVKYVYCTKAHLHKINWDLFEFFGKMLQLDQQKHQGKVEWYTFTLNINTMVVEIKDTDVNVVSNEIIPSPPGCGVASGAHLDIDELFLQFWSSKWDVYDSHQYTRDGELRLVTCNRHRLQTLIYYIEDVIMYINTVPKQIYFMV